MIEPDDSSIQSLKLAEWPYLDGFGKPMPTLATSSTSTAAAIPRSLYIEAKSIGASALKKVHAGDDVRELRHVVGLNDIPCGTQDHVLGDDRRGGRCSYLNGKLGARHVRTSLCRARLPVQRGPLA
ncbi:hypothetical protein FVE85_9679 [Porphyridium purpureum]|uniref:Uncharacterized protein n=1 Tax=Porphyridium purpureum TaxID=35688 RepID=A0A5J4YKX4_PORPP|nr:hypothetical protein FVE85_9679 [Porphyridium purpureum]|eukprot:POR6600..scf246_12